MKFLWWVLLPVLSLLGDEVPASKVGLSTIDVPTGVVREWSAWGRSKRYLFEPKFKYDLSKYSTFTSPLRVIAIADDKLATPASCFDLASEYINAQTEEVVLDPVEKNLRLGHFGFFREKAMVYWGDLFDWYDEQLTCL